MAIEYIKRHIATEKPGYKDLNKYVFEVDNLLTKSQIKHSLIELFNLDPKSIVSINTHRPPQKQKQRALGGKKIPLKRAILTLKTGEKIFPNEAQE